MILNNDSVVSFAVIVAIVTLIITLNLRIRRVGLNLFDTLPEVVDEREVLDFSLFIFVEMLAEELYTASWCDGKRNLAARFLLNS